ncbi:hisA/hisF family protein [Methanothermus fervidus DSM 2088]|uniref:HisA/hisF family protein n=1 Tax=Methanothermus fervidus (strain ATCC 43054 / DSM 2088 / JCM 10308 / V24 S) TaxID=523846 RepID=E3GXC2_METFV|nr:HisA/HisF family protein [Methanothermus fervidus]ADP76954.1 hisA/hisF family protein [Methanothermus fervidus DSM 2088]
MIEVIPVLDIKDGIAVAGKSGKRETYTPLKTIYSRSPDPIEIALSLRRQGARRIYIADLNGIERTGNNLEIAKKINYIIPTMLDFGVNDFKTFKFLLNFSRQVIVATETLESFEELEKIVSKFPTSRIVVSVDIKDDKLYSKNLDISLIDFRDKLLDLGISSEIILLDISRVGTEKGINENIIEIFKDLKDKLILGGGITLKDVPKIKNFGIKKILVGTALHKGEFPLYI